MNMEAEGCSVQLAHTYRATGCQVPDDTAVATTVSQPCMYYYWLIQTATYCNVARNSLSYKSETECTCEVLQAQSSAKAQCLGDRVLAVNKQ